MTDVFKSHGITADTPKNIVLGAGTIHKGLKYTAPTYEVSTDKNFVAGKTYYTRKGSGEPYTYEKATVTPGESVSASTYYEKKSCGWNAAESIIGATSGGNKFAITPEITDLEIDGAMVKVAGLAVKTTETATLETNLVEITPDIIKTLTSGVAGAGLADYDEIVSKARIEKGDYIQNFGYVGKTLEGEPIIITFDYALCNTGLEWDAKAKEAGVLAATFECYAPLEGDLETLPWHMYFPKKAAE